jgi:undecaprenyl-diphosphatase
MEKKMTLAFYWYCKKNRRFGTFMNTVAKASSCIFILIYLSCAAFVYFKYMKITEELVLYVLTPAATLVLCLFLRKLIRRPRPFSVIPELKNVRPKKSWSFPSNHASCASVIAFSCMFVNFYFGAAVFLLAIITGMSRLFVGVHYPSDVFGGFVLGGIMSVVGYSILARIL